MKFIFSYLKKYKWMVAIAMTIKLSATVGELLLPYVLEHLVDDVAPSQNVESEVYFCIGEEYHTAKLQNSSQIWHAFCDMQDMKTKGRRPLFYNVEMQNHISI